MGERGDEGFEVVPTRISGSAGPARSRRRRISPVILVIILAVAIPTIAWVGPRIEWRPEVDLSFLRPAPTPVPTATPDPTDAPSLAIATPLPAITVGVGPRPAAPFPVDVGGLRLADAQTGALGPELGLRGDTDAIFTSPGGESWWCVCFAREPGVDSETATVAIRRVDQFGRVTQESTVGEYRSVAAAPSQDISTRFDLEISPDERTAYLASATRNGDQWTLAVEAIDLATGRVAGRTDFGSVTIPPVPGPTPPPDEGTIENYLSGPSMRLSPDGRQLLVWYWIEINSPLGPQEPADPQAWLIDLDTGVADGSLGRLTSIGPAFVTRVRTCYWVAWATADELAAICWPTDQSSSILALVLLSRDGTELGRVELADANNSWVAEPVLDRANRLVYAWLPTEHSLRRVDLDRRRVDELRVDPAATAGGPSRSGSGAGGPSSALRPEWASFTSDMRIYYGPQLVAEPGGSRLFALGILQDEGSRRHALWSSGIWVFDSSDFSLLDRWDPLAAYGSIGLSSDRHWLLAVGNSGEDEHGNTANWQTSITVHDVSDGRPALQLGSLGTDATVLQVPP